MAENIYLFIPNIIGYIRVVLALASFYFMPSNHVLAAAMYLLSGFMDALDGHAARYFHQCSRLGALLDMVTDRFTTMGLLATLCYLYPSYMFLFQLSMVIDIVSHWIHTQSSLIKGASSHKVIDLSANPVLRHYYHNKIILFLMCSANELFYCFLYLCYFTPGPALPLLNIGLWKIVVALTLPPAVMKTGISLLQLWAACENVVAIDIQEREDARKNKAN